jgi:cell wall-associated NlpC family hydrolase
MATRNQLFFISFTLIYAAGCSTISRPPADVVDARPMGPANTVATPPLSAGAGAATAPDSDMLFHALMAAGVDYRRGGTSYQKGFDCSGLVVHVYREAYGLTLPHNTKAQSDLGDAVDRSELQPGDLVFFNTLRQPYSHVGIYVGEGRFIHAPKEGAVVRTESLRARYWAMRFDGARRIVPAVITADYTQPAKKPVVTHP